jgi:enamine deaminase RidA (YjgF/YER057c/UK114 family)
MITEYVNPPGMHSAAYTHAVVAKGTPVFITGQISLDEAGNLVGPGDIDAQVRQTWKNIQSILDQLGAGLQDIVKLTTYATDVRYMQPIGAYRRELFGDLRLPGSTFLVVTALARPELLVEIEAIVMLER